MLCPNEFCPWSNSSCKVTFGTTLVYTIIASSLSYIIFSSSLYIIFSFSLLSQCIWIHLTLTDRFSKMAYFSVLLHFFRYVKIICMRLTVWDSAQPSHIPNYRTVSSTDFQLKLMAFTKDAGCCISYLTITTRSSDTKKSYIWCELLYTELIYRILDMNSDLGCGVTKSLILTM